MTPRTSALGYFFGDDELGLERAAEALARRLEPDLIAASYPDSPMPAAVDRWRTRGEDVDAATLAERVATAPLFGGGTIVIVREPGPLVRSAGGREALVGVLDIVAPGNGLAFVEPVESGAKPSAGSVALRDAVGARGGEVRELRAPTDARMTAWIEEEARRQGVRLGPGAAQELAARVGAAVREGDVDRRQTAARAAAELEKLGLYRLDAPVSREDVGALVSATIPASSWALLDAVGERKVRRAAELLDPLLRQTPEPVVLTQLHRRIRELIVVGDLLASGTPEPALVRLLKLNPYRAKVLARQAARWRLEELEAALDSLLELDAAVKGADPATPHQVALRFQLWIRDRVAGGRGDVRSGSDAPRAEAGRRTAPAQGS